MMLLSKSPLDRSFLVLLLMIMMMMAWIGAVIVCRPHRPKSGILKVVLKQSPVRRRCRWKKKLEMEFTNLYCQPEALEEFSVLRPWSAVFHQWESSKRHHKKDLPSHTLSTFINEGMKYEDNYVSWGVRSICCRKWFGRWGSDSR